MIKLTANKAQLLCTATQTVTSGSQNAYICQFLFSSDWDGLERTAVFRCGGRTASVVLNSDGQCTLPWETVQTPGSMLCAGVYGTNGDLVVLPTVWAEIGIVQQGVTPGESAAAPTEDVYSQILALAASAQKLAQQLSADAAAGAFNGQPGATPVKGTDYFTAADKAELVAEVVAALPKYAGEVVA